MSKIGKLPVSIPAGVTVTVNPGLVTVKGPKGELKEKINNLVTVEVNGAELVVKPVDESKNAGAAHGLYRNLIHNRNLLSSLASVIVQKSKERNLS